MRKAAGFIIFRKKSNNIQYLLLRASYRKHHWGPPKGHLDFEESYMEAAYRETEEESGLCKEDLKIYPECLNVLNYLYKGEDKKLKLWLAELVDTDKQVLLSREHEKYEWCNLETACEYTFHRECLQNALRNCQTFIEQN